jgi:hypothetical protein
VITQEVQQPFQGELTLPAQAGEFRRRAKAVAGAIGNVVAAIAEPFRGPMHLELLDPKVRARMTAQEKGIVDAYLHGV